MGRIKKHSASHLARTLFLGFAHPPGSRPKEPYLWSINRGPVHFGRFLSCFVFAVCCCLIAFCFLLLSLSFLPPLSPIVNFLPSQSHQSSQSALSPLGSTMSNQANRFLRRNGELADVASLPIYFAEEDATIRRVVSEWEVRRVVNRGRFRSTDRIQSGLPNSCGCVLHSVLVSN